MINLTEQQEKFNAVFELLECECDQGYICPPCELDQIFTETAEMFKREMAVGDPENLLEKVYFPGTTDSLDALSIKAA